MSRQHVISLAPLSGTVLQMTLLTPGTLFIVLAFAFTPCGGHTHPVALPQVVGGELLQDSSRDLWITLAKDGSVFLDLKWYAQEQAFSDKLREVVQRRPQTRFLVRLDRRLSFVAVRHLLKTIQSAGIRRVVLLSWEGYPYELMWPSRAAA